MKPAHIAILIFFTTLGSQLGCGQSPKSTLDRQGEQVNQIPTAQLLAPPPLPEIPNIEALNRPQPKSTQEAASIMQEMRNLYGSTKVPRALSSDLSIESAFEFAKGIKLIQTQLPGDVEWLKKLDTARLAGGDQFIAQKLDRERESLLSRMETYLPSELSANINNTRNFIDQSIDPSMWAHIRKAAEIDMSDQTAVKNRFGNELLNQSIADQLRRLDEAFGAGIVFKNMLAAEQDYERRRDEFYEVVDEYRNKLTQAADAILPPEGIKDAELAKAAASAFDRAGLSPYRIIVNTRTQTRSKDHFTVDFGERSIEKSPYRWQEFQVATIEKDDDQYSLWYSTVLKYDQGPSTVPVGKWVLGPRHKSAIISSKNIDR